VKCSLEICEQRDPKGLYKKARQGEITNMTGISAPYEEPENPELIIDTDQLSLEESIDVVVRFLIDQRIIPDISFFNAPGLKPSPLVE